MLRLVNRLLRYCVGGLALLMALLVIFNFAKQLPERGTVSYQKAQRYLALDQTDDAIQELERAVCQKRNFSEAYALLGKVHISKERYAGAQPYLKKALQIRGGDYPQASLDLARAYFMLGNIEDAKNVIKHALALRPEFAGGICMLGQIFEKEGNRSKALRYYVRAMELNPRLAEAHFRAGLVYLKEGNPNATQKEYLALLEYGGDLLPEWQKESDRIVSEKERETPSLDSESARARAGVAPLTAAAQELKTSGAIREATEAYRKVVSEAPRNSDALLNLGILYNATGRFNDAADVLAQLVTIEPGNANAHCYLGEAFANRGERERAQEALKRALALDPGLAEAYIALAITLLDDGKDRDAEGYLERVIRITNTNPQAYYYLGIAYYRLDKIDDARDALQRVLMIDPYYADAHRLLWLVCQKESMMKRGDSYFKRFPYRKAYLMGVALYRGLRFKEAIERFDEALGTNPRSIEAQLAKALCLVRLGKVDEAVQLVKGILRDKSRYLPAKVLLAAIYRQKGDEGAYKDMIEEATGSLGSPTKHYAEPDSQRP